MNRNTIVTVCSGNMFRSPVAAFCLQRAFAEAGLDDSINFISRGIQGLGGTTPPKKANLTEYPLEWGYSEPELTRWKIDIINHHSAVMTEEIAADATLILAMDWMVLYTKPNSLIRLFPDHAWKVRLFSEIDGRFENIDDVFQANEPTPYAKAIELIDGIARRGTNYIKQWITIE